MKLHHYFDEAITTVYLLHLIHNTLLITILTGQLEISDLLHFKSNPPPTLFIPALGLDAGLELQNKRPFGFYSHAHIVLYPSVKHLQII